MCESIHIHTSVSGNVRFYLHPACLPFAPSRTAGGAPTWTRLQCCKRQPAWGASSLEQGGQHQDTRLVKEQVRTARNFEITAWFSLPIAVVTRPQIRHRFRSVAALPWTQPVRYHMKGSLRGVSTSCHEETTAAIAHYGPRWGVSTSAISR